MNSNSSASDDAHNPRVVKTSFGWRAKAGRISPRDAAIFDLIEGGRRWYLWTFLGWHDVRQRYRRSFIGPFWLTLSSAVLVAALGFLYSNLLRQDASTFVPFIAAGFICWGFIASTINESCVAFVVSEGVIKQVPMPLVVHVLRVVTRNFVILLHNALIWIVVAFVFSIPLSWQTLFVIPGLALVCLNLAWIGLILAIVCARFRDVPQVVLNVLQIAFFVTPIIWQPELIQQGRFFLIESNPFHHLISIMREPLLNVAPSWLSWTFCLVMTLLGWLLAGAIFLRYRRYISYWV